jgi:hypothetical protein
MANEVAVKNYPRGQLNAADEGALLIRIAVQDRTIIVDFGKPVMWLGLDASTARALGEKLIARADDVAQVGGTGSEREGA